MLGLNKDKYINMKIYGNSVNAVVGTTKLPKSENRFDGKATYTVPPIANGHMNQSRRGRYCIVTDVASTCHHRYG